MPDSILKHYVALGQELPSIEYALHLDQVQYLANINFLQD